jgi:hypothetical protein
LIQAGSKALRSEIHKLSNSIWIKKELQYQRKESVIILICEEADKVDCNSYRGISVLPTTYKILSNILALSLTPFAKELIGDHQCGF